MPPSTPPYVTSIGSINVGKPRNVTVDGHTVITSIWKQPVTGRIHVGPLNVEGDQQSDLRVHGGRDKAIYAYAAEDIEWWSRTLGRTLGPGAFGENLTTRNVDLTNARIGDHWAVGSAVLEISQPRVPCFKLGLRFADPLMPKRFAAALRPGAYLRVVTAGEIAAGDAIEIRTAGHDVSVRLVAEAYLVDHRLAPRLIEIPELAKGWRDWAAASIERA